MKIEEIRKDPWFQKNYSPVKLREDEQVNLNDVQAVFDDIKVCSCFLFSCLIYTGKTCFCKCMCLSFLTYPYIDEKVYCRYNVCIRNI